MFLEFPSLGGMPNPQRASHAAAGQLMPRLRGLRFLLLPVLLLALGAACHKSSSHANDPGHLAINADSGD